MKPGSLIRMLKGVSMKKLELKYGCNPNQKPACIYMDEDKELPIKVLSGSPGYINLLDALNAWQLVKELKKATGYPAAASFKHVSPAGAAIGLELDETLKRIYFVEEDDLSPLACAYARARGADRMSSFGDFIALSDVCDVQTAMLIKPEVSDGIIAPGYKEEALQILRDKKKGKYNIIEIDKDYNPPNTEVKQVFGVNFEQGRNNIEINEELLEHIVSDNKTMSEAAKRDLMISMITIKYTQSNSVCYVKDGQAIGIGAGQQSRIHCTRLAGNKADFWYLRQAPNVLAVDFVDGIGRADRDNTIDIYIGDNSVEELLSNDNWKRVLKTRPEEFTKEEKKEFLKSLTDVSLGSDAFFPFGDNIERAYQSGVKYIAQPGGSVRDDNVIEACNKYGIVMAHTGLRLFHH